jgi:crossover junction endodeoxyribonuclease RusA
MTASVTFTLPMPPKALSPNARPHWAALASAKKKYRAMARQACTVQCMVQGLNEPRWQRSRLSMLFTFKVQRRRDLDNLVASMKAAIDGIKSAGLIYDDDEKHLTPEPPRTAVVAGTIQPFVTLTVTQEA